jgi:hypothetical protein
MSRPFSANAFRRRELAYGAQKPIVARLRGGRGRFCHHT